MAERNAASRLEYIIAARDAEFRRVADRVIKRLERIERGSARSSRSMERLARVANRLSVANLVAWAGGFQLIFRGIERLKEAVPALDRLAKQTRNLGVTANQFQAWTQAAREAGIELGGFRRSLLRFSQSVGDAITQGGAYEKMFDNLSVSLRNAAGEVRGTGELFYDVLDRLNDIGSISEQQSIIQKLFGRGSKDTRALLSQGSEFLKDFERVYKETRRGVDPQTLALAEKLQNMQDSSRGFLDNQLNRLLTQLDDATKFTESNVGFLETLGKVFAGYADLVQNFNTGGPGQTLIEQQNQQRTERADNKKAEQDRLDAEAKKVRDADSLYIAMREHKARIRLEEEAIAKAVARHKQLRVLIKDQGYYVEQQIEKEKEKDRILQKQVMRLREMADDRKRDIIAQNRNNRLYDEELLAQIRPQFNPSDTSRLVETGQISEQEALRLRQKEYREYINSLNQTGTWIGYVRGAMDSLNSSLTAVILGTQTVSSAFHALISQILASILQQQIVGPIVGLVGSFLTGGGAAVGAASPALLNPRASGGPVSTGQRYLVGERGPELFVPGSSGAIVPNHQLGGSPVNIAINVTSTDGPGVRAAIAAAEPALKQAVLREVAVRQSRPGSQLGRQIRRR